MGENDAAPGHMGEDVVPECGLVGAAEGVEGASEDVAIGESEKGEGTPAMFLMNVAMNIPEDVGVADTELLTGLSMCNESDLEMEVGSEEGDDVLCDVCKIWRRSHQWKEHVAGRCHQRKSKERRREQQRQDEQGRVRGELLEVEDRIARLLTQ